MRVISDIEKKIIDRICEGHTHISTLFTDHIPDLLLSINKDTQKVGLFLSQKLNDKLVERATEQTEKIIYIIKFLIYLENEGYALSGYFAHGRSVNPTMGLQTVYTEYSNNPSNYSFWNFTDERMNKFIFAYSDLTIFPTNTLKVFRANMYRTSEDIRHNQMKNISIVAIIVSLLLGILSIIQNTYTNTPTKEQVNQILYKVDKIQRKDNYPTLQQIDTLIKINPTRSQIDTIIKMQGLEERNKKLTNQRK